jgi:EAL domain-containing protein (putative c-di-GMP-specific phosphodiesterase class I)
MMQTSAETSETLDALTGLGVRVAVDDFGTGYSSLSYLKRFHVDTLKVDRSFVRDITSDADDAAIVLAIIALAHGLGMQVVAEGVETEAQLEFLRLHGCDKLQGFLLARPQGAAELAGSLCGGGPAAAQASGPGEC